MKNFAFLSCFLLFCLNPGSSQDCSTLYTDLKYSHRAERNVVYGVAPRFNGVQDTLKLDIFKPVGDDNTSRPLIIWIHGGGFFGGARTEFDTLGILYAKRGYVAVSISYRLGFYNPFILSYPYTYDTPEVLRAGYRAMQDAKAAIRFMKARNQEDSTDIHKVFIGGGSAGGITALHAAFADRPEEKPEGCDSIAPVQILFSQFPRPDLGPVSGELNQNGFDDEVQGVVSIFGALFDTAYIESADDVPLFLYHQDLDPVVGCEHVPGLWNLPLNFSANYPKLFGSCVIEDRVQNLGYSDRNYQSIFFPGNEHNIHDFELVDQAVAGFLSGLICVETTETDEPLPALEAIRAFPNPFTTQLNVLQRPGAEPAASFQLMDLNGRTLINLQANQHAELNTIYVESLPPGCYMLRVITANRIFGIKVIKQGE